MAKVIGIQSRNEISELPFSQDDSVKAMEALMNLDIHHDMIRQLVSHISNNSGVDTGVIIAKRLGEIMKKAGK